jgi:hypothetical protein
MQEQKSLIKKLVANARAIISYQIGLPVGCIKMNKILTWLTPYEETLDYPVFRDYLNEAYDLPLGSERLRWNRDALRRYDERLISINLKYREKIIDTCFDIIEKYNGVETTANETK